MKMVRFNLLVVGLIAALVLSDRVSAQEVHYDIFLARPDAGTKTIVGGADVDQLIYDDVVRIFEVELGEVGSDFLSLEPGVNHPDINDAGLAGYPASATALLPGDKLRLLKRNFSVENVVDDLFFWDGTGAVSFAPAAANFIIDGGDPLGSTAGTGGVFDDHPFLTIDSTSLPGIYLASAVGVVDGFDPSDPVFLVMGTESLITADFLGITQMEFDLLTDDDLEEALDGVIELGVEYVEANVAVPEPGSLALLAIACCGLATAHRRRNRISVS